MGVERYIAVAGLGLFGMFVGEMITVYTFMIDPAIENFEPEAKLLQFISIGAAPAVIMAGVSYIMSRRYGSRFVGSMILAGGAVLLAGCAYVATISSGIRPEFMTDSVMAAPVLFMAVSVPVMAFGGMLFRLKRQRPKKDYI